MPDILVYLIYGKHLCASINPASVSYHHLHLLGECAMQGWSLTLGQQARWSTFG